MKFLWPAVFIATSCCKGPDDAIWPWELVAQGQRVADVVAIQDCFLTKRPQVAVRLQMSDLMHWHVVDATISGDVLFLPRAVGRPSIVVYVAGFWPPSSLHSACHGHGPPPCVQCMVTVSDISSLLGGVAELEHR